MTNYNIQKLDAKGRQVTVHNLTPDEVALHIETVIKSSVQPYMVIQILKQEK